MAHVSVSRNMAATRPDVWALVSDIANAGRWNRAWTSIEFAGNQTHGEGTRFIAHTESGDSFEFEVCEWSVPERIGFCPVRDPEEPTYAVMLDAHVFDIQPGRQEDETLVQLTAHATAHGIRGWIIATWFWPGHQRDGLAAALDSIAAEFEPDAPDPAEPDDGPGALTT
jgi:hypothetical protein